MKKAKKEIKKNLGPQAVKYKFTPDRMTFTFNGQDLFMTRSQASFLFGRNVEREFEKAGYEDDDFSTFETVESLSLFRFHSRRHVPVWQIAEKLHFPVDKYIRWINLSAARVNELMQSHQHEIDKRVVELEEQDPLPEPEKEEYYWPDSLGSTGRKVAKMMFDGLGPRQIAEKLKVSHSQFIKWYLDKDVMRNLMMIRNEEAGNRARKNKEITGGL